MTPGRSAEGSGTVRELRRPARLATATRSGALSLALVAAVLWMGCRDRDRRPPNVLLVTFDALRQDHLSLLGYPRPTTPRLDALARRGTFFRTIVPTSCSTKASLTSLLTSLDYSSHRLIEHAAVLPPQHETLAESFRDRGYRTAAAVATPHLAGELGYDQGFDRYWDARDETAEFVSADLVAGAARRFLAEPGDERPFFLYLHFEEPHPPWVHPSPWVEHGTEATRFFDEGCGYVPRVRELEALDPRVRHDLIAKYDGALRFADEQLGSLIDALAASGELDRTLVAVSTDHGLELLDRYSASHGFNAFDEVLRGFLVLFDGRRPARDGPRFVEAQGRIFDVGPTLLAAAGLPPAAGVDGIDLIAERDALPRLAFATCYGFEVARSERYKLVSFDLAAGRRWYRRTHRPRGLGDGLHLFDLRADPGERTNLADLRPELRDRLWHEIERYRARPARLAGDASVVPDDERDARTLERLRSLGYID